MDAYASILEGGCGDFIMNKKSFFSGLALGIALVIVFNLSYKFITTNLRLPLSQNMSVDQKISNIYSILDSYYVNEYDKSSIQEGIYAGLVSELGDPYTAYMDSATLTSFMERTEGSYAGVGIVVSVDTTDNRIVVVSPFEGSPAHKAGVMPGDKIIKINDSAVGGDNFNHAVEMMKGKPGTTVKVTIFRESESNSFDVQIVRENIDIPTVSHKMLDNDIGYIRIISFDAVTTKQFTKSYEELQAQNMKSLIIDLRNNPGGLLKVVCEIADMLVDSDYIVYTEDKNGKREYTYGNKDKIDIPLVVLINGNSASASEVLSGAIKDTGTGVLVGTKSFGKGLVQNIYFLPDGSGVKVTIAKYYTPSGICIDGEGIVPDYTVDMSDDLSMNIASLTLEEDVQLKKAVDIATVKMALQY